VRVEGGGYTGEGRGWGGGYIFNTFNTPMQRPKRNFLQFFFISLRQSGWFSLKSVILNK
jgi:hypothetical protein